MEPGSSDKKLGQILIELKVLTTSQLADALVLQEQRKIKKEPHLKLGQLLVAMGFVKLDGLQSALRKQTHKAAALRKMAEDAQIRSRTSSVRLKSHGRKEESAKESAWDKIKSLFQISS